MITFKQFLEHDLATIFNSTRDKQSDILNRINDISVLKVSVRPQPEWRSLLFNGQVKGRSDLYDTQLLFRNVVYKSDEPGAYTVKGLNGQEYSFEPLGYHGNDVEPHCSCPQFDRVHGSGLICKHVVKLAQYLKNKGVLVGSSPYPY